MDTPQTAGGGPQGKGPGRVQDRPALREPQAAASPSREDDVKTADVGRRVQSIIEAAEQTAAAITEDAKAEARRLVDATREQLEKLSAERTELIRKLTDDVTTRGRELTTQAHQLREQTQALARAMEAATDSLVAQFENLRPADDGPTRTDEAARRRFAARDPDSVEGRRWNDTEMVFEDADDADEHVARPLTQEFEVLDDEHEDMHPQDDEPPVRRLFGRPGPRGR